MMRFVDSTKAHGWWVDSESIYGGQRDAATKRNYDVLRANVLRSTCFDIQSVAERLWDQSLSGWWDSAFSPPFERMILEYAMGGYMDGVAIFATARDIVSDFKDTDLRLATARHWWGSVTNGIEVQEHGSPPNIPLEQARWLVTLLLFARSQGDRHFRAPIARACFALDHAGRPLSDGENGYGFDMWISDTIVRHIHGVAQGDGEVNAVSTVASRVVESDLIQPFMATMALLNTKNIGTKEVLPSRQQRRDAERRHVDPPVTYRVLTVKVPGSDRTSTAQRQTNLIENTPLHIVRGHLARYGPEFDKGKLFGKYEGQFWIPAHVRGTTESGQVVKDYNVKAPREAA